MAETYLQSVDNALMVLELLAESSKGMSLTEIARALDVSKSTAFRTLYTLERRGFISRTDTAGRYCLGIKMIQIGAGQIGRSGISKLCGPLMEQLSFKTGETVYLETFSNGQVIYIDEYLGQNDNFIGSIVGSTMPAYTTAAGRVFLAYLPEEALTEYFQNNKLLPLTPHTVTSEKQLREILKRTRETGYGEDEQEAQEGVACFASPIFDHHGKVSYAVSISGSYSRMLAQKKEFTTEVKQTCNKISELLGVRA